MKVKADHIPFPDGITLKKEIAIAWGIVKMPEAVCAFCDGSFDDHEMLVEIRRGAGVNAIVGIPVPVAWVFQGVLRDVVCWGRPGFESEIEFSKDTPDD